MPTVNNEIYDFGDFRLDVGERRLERRDGRPNGSLPEKAFQTLVLLVRNNGALIAKEEFLSTIWPDTVVEENNLGKAIYAVRQVLSQGIGEQVFIETVPKHGYRFVADVIRIETEAASGSSPKAFPSRSPAYDLYIRGKVKAGSENIEDTENAIKVLEAAIAVDPFFAPAYAQLARAFNTRAFKFSAGPQRKILHENAEVAVEKALGLDPNLAEGHFARGLILWTNSKGFPHEQAIKSYKRALYLDPTSDEAHHQLSMVYAHIGLMDEAHDEVEMALELNPNNTMARFRVGVYKVYEGKFDEAVGVFKTIPRDVSPMLVDRCMAEVLIQLGRDRDAQAITSDYLSRFPEDEGGSFTSVQAVLLARAGKRTGAEENIQRAEQIGKDFGHFHHTAHNIAAAYAAMNMPDEAVSWLERAADDGFPNYTYFKIDNNLTNVRAHASMVDFMARLGLRWERFRSLT
jgi:DNA-binding winged helix-turn-helix (wHTH) protein/lipopolysaccharide biosynthesis regulator YciM